MRIVQQFLGHDALNNLRMDSYIDGNLPNFASGSKITIDDYTENYKKLETGMLTVLNYILHFVNSSMMNLN